ncbi:MAG: chloride channel protein, partial [Verrucomicrobiota bacterium]|nr:chloride channel protein [Verrucomicrobiota bacterium]
MDLTRMRAACERARLLAPTGLREACGLAVLAAIAALAVMGFHALTLWIEAHTLGQLERQRTSEFVIGSFITVVGGSAVATWLIATFAPTAGGGGVLPVKLAFWRNFGGMRKREAAVKLAASAITLGCGVSLGPEGPSIQIGAAAMSSAAGSAGIARQARR